MTEVGYRAVFEASPDGILVVDGEGCIEAANPMACRLFGYEPSEVVGRPVELLVPPSLRGAHREHRSAFMAAPRARPMGIGLELSGCRSDGTTFPVEISLSPAGPGDPPRVIATVRDVTQRKRLRSFGAGALRASEEERRRIARELHDDTAQHLAALLLRLRVMERDDADGRWRDRLRALRDEISACAEGVRRVARGLRPPELEDAGVVAALRAHIRALQDAIPVRISFETDPVDDLLGADARLVLYRIVQEALSNAIRHGEVDAVAVRVRRQEGRVLAVVRDRGRGFEPGREDRSGPGLGLQGMRERAAMVGGRVDIRSAPGEGTTVTVTLPAAQKGV